jgi:hypothetical protein
MLNKDLPEDPRARAWAAHDRLFIELTGSSVFLRPAFAGEVEALDIDKLSRLTDRHLLYVIGRRSEDRQSVERRTVWLEPVEFWTPDTVNLLIRTLDAMGASGLDEISVDEIKLYFGAHGGRA